MGSRPLFVSILAITFSALSSFAAAGPIHLPKSAEFLSAEDLQILAERPDRGLHLGWFKSKDSRSGPETVDPTDPMLADSWIGLDTGSTLLPSQQLAPLPLFGAPVLSDLNPITSATVSASETVPAAVPEPSSLLLTGVGGIALLARRRHKQAARLIR